MCVCVCVCVCVNVRATKTCMPVSVLPRAEHPQDVLKIGSFLIAFLKKEKGGTRGMPCFDIIKVFLRERSSYKSVNMHVRVKGKVRLVFELYSYIVC